MTKTIDNAYTKTQFQSALRETLEKLLIKKDVSPLDSPTAILLGGQSGAGKSTLHRIFGDILKHNVIVINGDEYRKSHPCFFEIQARYGMDAPAHTAKWAGEMTEALIDALSAQHYNLIVEGTLRTSAVPLKTATLLRERGYAVSLAIMAVKPEISLVSCQIRYELMRIAGTTPRATDPAHHNKIIEEIANNLETLEKSELYEEVFLYNRAGECLFPSDSSAQTASATLRDILFGAWTPDEETHFASLNRQLEELKQRSEGDQL